MTDDLDAPDGRNDDMQGTPLAGVEQILPLVYDELKQLAQKRMSSEPPGHTLQPTALVHEVYLRLLRDGREDWSDRSYFMSAAALAMRRILIERARRYRGSCRRSCGWSP